MSKEGYAMNHCGVSPNFVMQRRHDRRAALSDQAQPEFAGGESPLAYLTTIVPSGMPHNAGQWACKRLLALASTAETRGVQLEPGLACFLGRRSSPAVWPGIPVMHVKPFLGRLQAEYAGPAHTPL